MRRFRHGAGGAAGRWVKRESAEPGDGADSIGSGEIEQFGEGPLSRLRERLGAGSLVRLLGK